MPSSPNYVRDYKQESKTSKARGEQPKNAKRKQAKRDVEKRSGKRCSGDVDHIDGNPNNNSPKNLRCISATKNRSYARNSKGGKKKSPAQNSRAYR